MSRSPVRKCLKSTHYLVWWIFSSTVGEVDLAPPGRFGPSSRCHGSISQVSGSRKRLNSWTKHVQHSSSPECTEAGLITKRVSFRIALVLCNCFSKETEADFELVPSLHGEVPARWTPPVWFRRVCAHSSSFLFADVSLELGDRSHDPVEPAALTFASSFNSTCDHSMLEQGGDTSLGAVSHIHTHTNTVSHTHTHKHCHTHTHKHSVTHTPTHTNTQCHTHTHTHKHTVSHTHKHSVTHTHTHTHPCAPTHTHTSALTHSITYLLVHMLTHSLPHSLTLSLMHTLTHSLTHSPAHSINQLCSSAVIHVHTHYNQKPFKDAKITTTGGVVR